LINRQAVNTAAISLSEIAAALFLFTIYYLCDPTFKTTNPMAFELPNLPYAFNALEPHIDAKTMEIHHGKHHQAYVTNLNNALANTDTSKLTIDEICRNISKYPAPVRNNGGGHYNHAMFWTIMKPGGGGQPNGKIAEAINSTFGNFDEFKTKFNAAGVGRFGSGWAWLIVGDDKKLAITSTPNQDNPLMDVVETRGEIVFGVDVWEHAYYLNYQNRRPDYLTAWWNTVNWDEINKRFAAL
jgi:Fe-Mn family superoxide dismutase